MTEQVEATPDRITRVVDFRIPLIWLIGGAVGIGWALISMWFSVNLLVKTVSDLQITVKSGNESMTVVAGEMALLKFRITTNESSISRINEAVTALQQKRGIR